MELVIGDAQALRKSFGPGSFDAVVCSFGVLHLPEPQVMHQSS